MGDGTEMDPTEAGPSETGSSDPPDPTLLVLRCGACGDTFPVHGSVEVSTCPSCGSEDVHEASEPLL